MRREYSLNRVHDEITIREGGQKLRLRVCSAPGSIVAGMSAANQMITTTLRGAATADQQREGATAFAEAIFGAEQARALLDFYNGDAACVLAICLRYFNERLYKLVVRAQKREK